MAALLKRFPQERTFLRDLYRKEWVVNAKEPFAGPDQVVEYLGRYTHKVAIGNHRLLDIGDPGVRFRYLDYRDHRQKEMTLDGAEFLGDFANIYCRKVLSESVIMVYCRLPDVLNSGLCSCPLESQLHW